MSKETEIQELSRRNAEIFNLVVRDQNQKILELQTQLNGVLNSYSTLQTRMTQLETQLQTMRIKMIGTGATT